MQREALLHIRCPACLSALRLTRYRTRRGVVSSGTLACHTCGHHMPVRARIPLLLPAGEYAWTFPPTPGEAERRYSEKGLQDNLEPPLGNYHFRRGLYQGTQRFLDSVILPEEEDDPEPETLLNLMISTVIERAPRRLLQINAAYGYFTRRLAGLRPAGTLTVATEVDFGRIKTLEGRIRRSSKPLDIMPVCAVDTQLPFPDNHFMMVVSFDGLKESRFVNKVLEEARRVLAPGGVFLITETVLGSPVGLGDPDPGSLIQYFRRQTLDMHHGETDLIRRLKRMGFAISHVTRDRKKIVRRRVFFQAHKVDLNAGHITDGLPK